MTIYDGVMIGVIVAGMVWGAIRGITWQVASLASLVLGYLVGFPASSRLAPHFPGDPLVARTLALLASYVAVSGGVFLVAWMIRATLRRLQFEALDRHLGMILGGLEGALLGVLGTVFVVSLAPQTRDKILSSPSGRIVAATLHASQSILPAEIRDHLVPAWATGDEATVAGTMPAPATTDPAAESKGLQGLLDLGTERVGRAVAKQLEGRIEQTGGTNGRDVERR